MEKEKDESTLGSIYNKLFNKHTDEKQGEGKEVSIIDAKVFLIHYNYFRFDKLLDDSQWLGLGKRIDKLYKRQFPYKRNEVANIYNQHIALSEDLKNLFFMQYCLKDYDLKTGKVIIHNKNTVKDFISYFSDAEGSIHIHKLEQSKLHENIEEIQKLSKSITEKWQNLKADIDNFCEATHNYYKVWSSSGIDIEQKQIAKRFARKVFRIEIVSEGLQDFLNNNEHYLTIDVGTASEKMDNQEMVKSVAVLQDSKNELSK